MGLKNWKGTNISKIGNHSSYNTVIQNNYYFGNNPSDVINVMSKAGDYEGIQEYFQNEMLVFKKLHPLYPDFSASPSKQFNRLVSTPEAKDAFEKFPKTIRSTLKLDYDKYPYMDKTETPWEYAYRTQSEVELETTAYQEFLGDEPDPFPNLVYSEGMITVIGYNEFPEPIEFMLSSGNISIPILLRRKPCLEYGKILLGSISEDAGFELEITMYKDAPRTDFTIKNIPACDINVRIQREKLYSAFLETKTMSIMMGSEEILTYEFNEQDLKKAMFLNSAIIAQYLECLSVIENHTNCKFDIDNNGFTEDDYLTALVFAASIDGKWYKQTLNFDDSIRCAYNKIPDEIIDFEQITFENSSVEILLQGQTFIAEKFTLVYENAKINNYKSVIKNKEKRREAILLTFRPVEKGKMFSKYYMLENIRHLMN